MKTLFISMVFIMVLAYSKLPAQSKSFDQFTEKTISNRQEIGGKMEKKEFSPFELCSQYTSVNTPLTEKSFNKMMGNDFMYAILGTKTPVSGFKLETTNPSITLSGNVFVSKQKRFLLNLQLTGAAQNNISDIFSQKKLNGSFSGSLGFNFLINRWQLGVFNTPQNRIETKHQVIAKYARDLSKAFDTAIVYNVLASDTLFKINSFAEFNSFALKIRKKFLEKNEICDVGIDSISGIARFILLRFGNLDSTNDNEALFKGFKKDLKQNLIENINDLEKKLAKAELLNNQIIGMVDDSCIAIFKEIWTRKRIWWINVTPTVSNSSITLYDESKKNVFDTTSLLYGVQVSANFLIKFKQNNRYVYGKFGLDFGKVNSLKDLKKFSYQTENELNNSNNSVLSKEKSGTAYSGKFDQGFGWDIFFELYAAPFKHTAIPGFYLRPQFSHGEPWLNKNKLSTDLGLIWNLPNSDQTKNVVSIVPYVNWSNFLTNYKDEAKVDKSSLSDLFSIGIKFGIPINIGN